MRLRAKSLSKGQDTLDQEEDDDGEKAELPKKVAKKTERIAKPTKRSLCHSAMMMMMRRRRIRRRKRGTHLIQVYPYPYQVRHKVLPKGPQRLASNHQ